MTDPTELDAIGQAALVRSGAVSPVELVQAAVDRIEATNPALNAVIHERFERALADAAGIDRSAPFAGVPYLAKDAGCALAGEPHHVGLAALRDAGYRTEVDSELALRFRRAGFVCVGRTNVPQLLLSATTESAAYGPARNPWATDRSTGGSSGGSAAAVAAGMVAVAHGNDAGGSIRIPAACCGTVGLKPTRSRVSDGPLLGQTWGGLNHEFALTRSIRDTAALLDALAGRAWGDPHGWPAPTTPWATTALAEPGRLRIRVVGAVERTPTDPEVTAAVEATAALLVELGHHVGPGPLPELEQDGAWGAVVSAAVARDIERLGAAAGITIGLDDLEPLPALIVGAGQQMSAADHLAALEAMHAYGRRLEARWAEFDVLLTPTVPVQQARLGELAPDADLGALSTGLAARTAFSAPFNVSGQPAISLPVAETAAGLPIGVQLVGAQGREDLLLQVGAQLEAARPWSGRRPAV